jgi:hypothetical protein
LENQLALVRASWEVGVGELKREKDYRFFPWGKNEGLRVVKIAKDKTIRNQEGVAFRVRPNTKGFPTRT